MDPEDLPALLDPVVRDETDYAKGTGSFPVKPGGKFPAFAIWECNLIPVDKNCFRLLHIAIHRRVTRRRTLRY